MNDCCYKNSIKYFHFRVIKIGPFSQRTTTPQVPHPQARSLSNPSAVDFNSLSSESLREELFKWHRCQGAQRTNYSKLVKSELLKWDTTCIKQCMAAVTAGGNVCIFKNIIIGSQRTEICDTDLNRRELDLNAILITEVSSDMKTGNPAASASWYADSPQPIPFPDTWRTGGRKKSCNLQTHGNEKGCKGEMYHTRWEMLECWHSKGWWEYA